MNPTLPTSLRDLPLWRLIVALDDAERAVGAGSSTARALAHALQDRLREQRQQAPRHRRQESPA